MYTLGMSVSYLVLSMNTAGAAQVTQIVGGEAAPKHQMPLGTVHFSGAEGRGRRGSWVSWGSGEETPRRDFRWFGIHVILIHRSHCEIIDR